MDVLIQNLSKLEIPIEGPGFSLRETKARMPLAMSYLHAATHHCTWWFILIKGGYARRAKAINIINNTSTSHSSFPHYVLNVAG